MFLAEGMVPVGARSSLERMLDSIRLRDEQPVDAPPALPTRPTMRGRLPSSRRPLPAHFKPGGNVQKLLLNDSQRREEDELFKMVKVEMPEESPYVKMPELESYEKRLEEADGSNSPPAPSCSAVSSDGKVGWSDTTDYVLRKIASVDDARNQKLQGIIWVQKHFRGLQGRRSFLELKKGVTTLQSFVRGERARCEFEFMRKRWKAIVLIQRLFRRRLARKTFYDQKKDIILLQSVIRGWLVSKHYAVLKSLEMPNQNHEEVNKDPSKNLQDIKDTNENKEHPQVCPSVLEELQRRVLQAEAALRRKEEENILLQRQLLQYETRWLVHEAKMKSMEERWQIQLTSLQMSLAAAKRSLVTDDMSSQLVGLHASSNRYYFDSEDNMYAEIHTPEGTTSPRQPCASDARLSRNSDATKNAVSHLVEEFDQHSQVFVDDAGFLTEEKFGRSISSRKPYEEIRKLKVYFAAWKKDYSVRSRVTKAALQRRDNSESDKARKRWWSTSCTR